MKSLLTLYEHFGGMGQLSGFRRAGAGRRASMESPNWKNRRTRALMEMLLKEELWVHVDECVFECGGVHVRVYRVSMCVDVSVCVCVHMNVGM